MIGYIEYFKFYKTFSISRPLNVPHNFLSVPIGYRIKYLNELA